MDRSRAPIDRSMPFSAEQRALLEAGQVEVGAAVRRLRTRWTTCLGEDEAEELARGGLEQAVQSYSPELGVAFGQYARFRVEGAILDGIRAESRRERIARAMRVAGRAFLAEQRDEGDVLRDSEEEQRRQLRAHVEAHAASMIEAMVARAREEQAEDALVAREEHARAMRLLEEARAVLPARDREILALRYEKGLEFVPMSKHFGVGESTLRRHHRSVLQRLGAELVKKGVTYPPPLGSR
jgi:RNA polymerase sigma factor for flagellar operon FliA